MFISQGDPLVKPNTFIADSGASTHMVHSKQFLSDFQPEVGDVKIGDNKTIKSHGKGTFHGYYINSEDKQVPITLQDVLLVPDLWVNLFSVTKAMENNKSKIIGENDIITVQARNSEQVHFNKVLPHGDGKILATEFYTTTACANPVLKTSYNDLHHKLGHANKQTVQNTAKHYGIKLLTKDTDLVCADCAFAKIRVKNFGHNDDNQASKFGERIAIDISSVKFVSYGGAKFWLLIQDEYTGYLWSFYLSAKSELPDTVISLIKTVQQEHNTTIMNIRRDNAGENLKLQVYANTEPDININFEFIAPHSPQQNGKIEQKFATLWGKARSMLNAAKFTETLRNKLWAQCANLATKLENILIIPETNTTPHEMVYGSPPDWIDNLHTLEN
jgi:hypothetical protein